MRFPIKQSYSLPGAQQRRFPAMDCNLPSPVPFLLYLPPLAFPYFQLSQTIIPRQPNKTGTCASWRCHCKHSLGINSSCFTFAGTPWNTNSNRATITTARYSVDATTSFSADEKQAMISIWRAVAEDYAVFDVDVTTEDPGLAGLIRTTTADNAYGVRVVIGGNCSDVMTTPGCGFTGIAYMNRFGWVGWGSLTSG